MAVTRRMSAGKQRAGGPFVRCAPVLIVLLVGLPASAHELRPAYLELREENPGTFHVLWKTPMVGDARLALEPDFSGDVEPITSATTRTPPGAAIQEWVLRAPALRGQALHIRGLESTMTDVLARIEFADGTSWTHRLTPRETRAVIPERESPLAVAFVYLHLGVEHILTGVDHLLFVLALILVAPGGWKLAKTVSAFTVAHGATLTAATLGFVHVPQRPVEAAIALSIVFVAAEIVHARRGRPGVGVQAPWAVAFSFGLLHGLGFAGALSEVGLPQTHIPLALLFFSVGVEIGHFLFVGATLSLIASIRRARVRAPRWAPLVPAYAIGGVAACWLVQRVAAF